MRDVEYISRIVPSDSVHMTLEKAKAIGALWEHLKPKLVLEVGMYQGVGACYLAAMCEHDNGLVWTVDLPWTGEENGNFALLAEHWIQQCGVSNVHIVRREDGAEGFMQQWLDHNKKLFDFIYIDAGHGWVSTAAQYAMAWALTRHGGWICFDDIEHHLHPDVGIVWKRLVVPRHTLTYEKAGMGFALVKRRP